MRVALDTTFAGLNPTGVGLYSKRLVEYVARLASERQITLRCIGPSCRDRSDSRPMGGIYQEWPIYTQIVVPSLLAKYKPDVIHSTSHLGPLWGGAHRVVTVHDLIFRRSPGDYNPVWLAVTRAMLPIVLRRASAIIADSQATQRDLQKFYSVPDDKVSVIYPGVDDTFRTPAGEQQIRAVRAIYGLGDSPYILCLGPWVRRKNLDVVVKAFSVVAGQVPNSQLVITGRTVSGMRGFSAASSLDGLSFDVRSRIHTVGHVSEAELRTIMQGASALAYPSLFEGFGLPPLEAMAAGVPVVASNTPAVVESTGGAAIIAAADEPREWAAALTKLLTDEEVARSLREAGKKRSAEFNWERCASQAIDLYQSLQKAN